MRDYRLDDVEEKAPEKIGALIGALIAAAFLYLDIPARLVAWYFGE